MTVPGVPVGRAPTQARARITHDRILDVAADLLVERGPSGVTMTDLADRAGVSIGSLYRWFPAQSSVVRSLAERHLQLQRVAAFEAIGTDGAPLERLERALRSYLAAADDPLVVQIIRSISSDPALESLDREDTGTNARLLAAAVGLPDDRIGAVEVVIDLAGHLIPQLAERSPGGRAEVTETFVRMARAALA